MITVMKEERMKKYLLAVMGASLLFSTPVFAAGYGDAGCGLGSLVFGDSPGLVQVFAAQRSAQPPAIMNVIARVMRPMYLIYVEARKIPAGAVRGTPPCHRVLFTKNVDAKKWGYCLRTRVGRGQHPLAWIVSAI